MDSEPIRDKLDLKNQTKQEKRREGKQTIERVVCDVVWYGMVWYDTSSCNAIYPIIISYYTILYYVMLYRLLYHRNDNCYTERGSCGVNQYSIV